MARKNYNKHQLREMYKNAVVHQERHIKISELKRILNLLTNREEYTDAKVIAFYWPKESELDTIPMIDFSLFHKKRVVLPFITSDKTMEFKEITSIDFEREKKLGITQPTKEHETIKKEDIDLFVIPVVAFNNDGHRVGSGKGYYDRYFEGEEEVTSIIVSLASRQHNFKVELHDIPSKIIITEKQLIRIHESGYHLNDKDELIIPTLTEEDIILSEEIEDENTQMTELTDSKIKDSKDDKDSEDKKQDENDEPDNNNSEGVDDLIEGMNDDPVDEAKKKEELDKSSLIKTIDAAGMTRREVNKKRKEETKEAKKKLKEQKEEAKKVAKAAENDSVEDDLRAKLANDDKMKKNDLSDIPDADKLLAILESKEEKPKKEKKEKSVKVKKEKMKKQKKPKKSKK